MTRILIPRSDNSSAKTVEASDWELYFGDNIINDYLICGLCVTAQCPNVLAVDIAAGNARVLGLHLNNSVTCEVTCLTACSTNKIYMQICRDPSCEPQGYVFGSTTVALPVDSFQIATAVTNATTVTSVNQVADTHVTKSKGSLSPIGTINMYGGSYCNIPSGWLLADGTAVSRTTYADLFDVVGTNFGCGDGSTTFNLPNLIEKFPRGAPACTNPGGTGGADTVTLNVSEIPSHSHPHSHTYCKGSTVGIAQLTSSPGSPGPANRGHSSQSTGPAGPSVGGGGAHENLPSYQQVLYIIKT